MSVQRPRLSGRNHPLRRVLLLMVVTTVALASATSSGASPVREAGGRLKPRHVTEGGVFGGPDIRRRLARAATDVTGTITPGGSPLTVTIANANDNAAITFSGTANQRVSLNLTSVSISFSYVSIRKPDGSDLVSPNAVFTSGKFIDTVTLPTTGTYTIYIDPYGSATGSMTLTLYDVPADAGGTITPGGASVTATTTVPGQNAVETWSGTQGDRVSLNATNITLNSGYEIVKILKPDGSTLASSGATSSHYFFDTMTLPTTGTYKVLVDPQDAATGTTTLTMYSVPADAMGAIAIGGAQRTPAVTVPGRNPTFTFTGDAGEPIKIQVSGSTILYSNISIQRPLGTKLVETSVFTGSATVPSSPPFKLPSSGTFYVVVDPVQEDTGSMTLSLLRTTAYEPLAQTNGTCPTPGGTVLGGHAVSVAQCLADPVNSLTGAFSELETDLKLPGKGLPFTFIRSYNSANVAVSGRLGPGWTDSYGASLAVQQNGDVTLQTENGQQVRYAHQDDGSFVGAGGARSSLTLANGTYQLATHDQATYSFNGQGKLTSMTDRDGNTVTLAYDGSGQLAAVTDSAGHTITCSSNGDGTLASISAPDGRTVSYGYTGGRLTSVTQPGSRTTTYHYDANGRLDQITDPSGHTQVQNTYGSDGRVSQQTDALGHTTSFSWDANTQTETATDPRGNAWKDVYSNNVLIKRIDPLGNVTQIGSDINLNRTSVTAPDGSTTNSAYDARGNVTSMTAPASIGAQKTLTYDANNNLLTATDARGKVTSYSYDAAGNNTQIVQDGTTIAQYTYNSAGQMTSSTDGRGKTTTYTYDTSGNLASVTDPLGNKTTYAYDAAGRRTSMVEPRGNVAGANPADFTTSYTYDAVGHVLTKTDPLGHTTTSTYDAAGNLTSVTDPRGYQTTYSYDSANRLTSVTAPGGPVTSYTYDAAGNRLTAVDPNNHTTSYSYDADNRRISETTPKGEQTTYAYDANGNLSKTVDPRGNVTGANPNDYATTYTYDAAGRLLTETDPLGNRTTYTSNTVGDRTSITDANGHTTTYTYDAAGRVLTATAPDGGVTTYTYDAAGNELTRTDADNHTTTASYDDDGHLASTTSPTGQRWTYDYDPNGNLKSVVDPNGNATQTAGDGTTTSGYDRANRLISIDYSDSTPDVTFAYDADGNRTSMTDGAGTQTRTYDSNDRLTAVTRGADTFSYTYDPLGNLTSRTYPDGTLVGYGYDEDNRLTSVTNGSAGTSFSYDADSNLTQTTLPASNGYAETRSYDRAGRLIEVKNAAGASVLSDFTATLDAVGNPTTIARTGSPTETATYTYDANDRLASVCYQTSCPGSSDPFIRWTYDKLGNRLTETRPSGTTTYSYNATDQLTAAGSTTHGYDQNGNETSAGGHTFAYDLANRLSSTTSGSATTTYSYDGDGNRLQASTGSQPTEKTNYLWDVNGALPQIALERDGNATLLRRYVYGQRRISMTSGGNDYYYAYDTVDSVSNLTSSNGATAWTYAYEPFGPIRTETQNDPNAPSNEMKFVGELADPTGLIHLRARELDPTTGRFLTRDPRPSSDTTASSYVYANDQPTVLTDPGGQRGEPIKDAAQAAVGASSAIAILTDKAPSQDEGERSLYKEPPPDEGAYDCIGAGWITVAKPALEENTVWVGAVFACGFDIKVRLFAQREIYDPLARGWLPDGGDVETGRRAAGAFVPPHVCFTPSIWRGAFRTRLGNRKGWTDQLPTAAASC
jgi:RHS repeat-associated protein